MKRKVRMVESSRNSGLRFMVLRDETQTRSQKVVESDEILQRRRSPSDRTSLLRLFTVALTICISAVAADSASEWQSRYRAARASAIGLYPEAAKEGSLFFNAVKAEIARCEKDEPDFLQNPEYPVTIVSRVASQLRQEAEHSTQYWQREAVRQFPDLGTLGTPLNNLFLTEHNRLRIDAPDFFDTPDWPMTLARKCAAQILAASSPSPSKTKRSLQEPFPQRHDLTEDGKNSQESPFLGAMFFGVYLAIGNPILMTMLARFAIRRSAGCEFDRQMASSHGHWYWLHRSPPGDGSRSPYAFARGSVYAGWGLLGMCLVTYFFV